MAEKKEKKEVICPLCLFMRSLSEKQKQYQQFFEHLNKARIEVLEAFKSLIEGRIEEIKKEKKKTHHSDCFL